MKKSASHSSNKKSSIFYLIFSSMIKNSENISEFHDQIREQFSTLLMKIRTQFSTSFHLYKVFTNEIQKMFLNFVTKIRKHFSTSLRLYSENTSKLCQSNKIFFNPNFENYLSPFLTKSCFTTKIKKHFLT